MLEGVAKDLSPHMSLDAVASPHFYCQTLQIAGLRNSYNLWMMQGLAQALAHGELASGIAGRLLHQALEARSRHNRNRQTSPTHHLQDLPQRLSHAKVIGDQLAARYEQGMSKYPLGQYRDRVGQNADMVYQKVIKKA